MEEQAVVENINSAFTGIWKSIDSKSGKEKSLIEISLDNDGQLHGKIIKLFLSHSDDPNPICENCEEDKKNSPVIGMEILYGFSPENKKNEDKWNSGKFLDTSTGIIYNCNLSLNESKDQLNVRTFVGYSVIGKTQTWIKESNQEE